MTNRVGIYGGTFDPPHNAHIRVAAAALEQFALSEVIFVPTGLAPDKSSEVELSKEHRYRMVSSAVHGMKRVSVSRIEMDRPGPSYTVDTLREMREDYPQGICFVIGADRMLHIDSWKEADELLRLVPFIVAPRLDVPMNAFARPPFDAARVFVLEMEKIDVSSTELREAAHRGESIDRWIPATVAAYIREHGLYGVPSRSH
ncbi:nicotinate (nicotinamide) nucleotide adenylyltransferase [Candidatus Bipolaricaulota bacterium]|nr:nicotinate (nicotinamide) nucleotide adenylyltransferase [Candidatus Bipolaricaulota bacterium]